MDLKNYSKPTQNYIKSVTQTIINTYGVLPPEFSINIQILADNVERYCNCMNDLNTRGTVFTAKDTTYINPSYKMVKECEETIFKLSKSFGLDSMNKGKIKVIEKNESVTDILAALTE